VRGRSRRRDHVPKIYAVSGASPPRDRPELGLEGASVGYRRLALLLGGVTLATFGTDRLLSETAGSSLGAVPAYVMAAVVLAVGVGALRAAVHGHGVETAVLRALGPVGGFAAYLVGYHLVRPPSTDSPTWFVFGGFAGGVVTVGVAAYAVSRFVERIR
jgi:hypothetical protein